MLVGSSTVNDAATAVTRRLNGSGMETGLLAGAPVPFIRRRHRAVASRMLLAATQLKSSTGRSMSALGVDTCTCREQDGCMGLAARSNKLHDASPTSCVFRRGPCAWRCQALLDQCSMLLHVIWIRHVAVSERARLRYMRVCQVAARITGTPARVLPVVS